MAVKRVTIELDDIPDSMSRTSRPASLMLKEDIVPEPQGNTDIPSRQADYQQDTRAFDSLSDFQYRKETIGRTPADLVFTFINRPEFMAVTLVFLAFLISVKRLQSMSDLWIPAVIGCVLNLIWFGIRGVNWLLNKKHS
jgi:hypothetical protein